MDCIKIPKGGRIIVCGDIHEHEKQVDQLLSEITPSQNMILVSVGDIYDKGYGPKVAESIIDKLMPFINKGHAFVIKGNHELKLIRMAKRRKNITKHLAWYDKQPLTVPFEFYNRTKLLVVHGGVKPSHTWEDLKTDIETCYIRQLDKNGQAIKRIRKVVDGKLLMEDEFPGEVWHKQYNGRFGYIASGHAAQKDGVPKFYNYSCNLDSAVYHTGKLTAQIFSENGREELLTFKDEAKYPDLIEMYRLMAAGRI